MLNRVRLSDAALKWVFLVPAVALLAFLSIYPFIQGLWISLHEWSFAGPERNFIGLGNFSALLTEERFHNSLITTGIFTTVSVTVELLLGVSLALYLKSLTGTWRNLCRTVFVIPMVVTPIATGLMWRLMLNSNIGVVNYVLRTVGVTPPEWTSSPLLAMSTIIVIDIWQWTPLVILIVFAGLLAIPDQLYEAAEVDGAPYWAVLKDITLPSIKYMIAIAAVFRLMRSFRSFDIIWLVTRGGPGTATEILNVYLYRMAFVYLNGGRAAALGLILLVITVGVCMTIVQLADAQ